MKTRRFIFSITAYLLLLSATAQPTNFQLNNPHSIMLDSSGLEILTAGYWRIFKDDLEMRGTTRSTSKNISMCYYPDGKLFYNGSTGTWKVLEDKYIKHKLDSKEAEDRLNFGGIFSVTALDSSTLTLTKLLTSSQDMKRTFHLKTSTILTVREQPNQASSYRYAGTLSEFTMDSISRMNPDELFNAGFTLLDSNMIHIATQDTLYVIKQNATSHPFQRIPWH